MEQPDFKKYINNIFANGFVMLSLALGHKLGIFKVLCKAEQPLSCQHLAEIMSLKERYFMFPHAMEGDDRIPYWNSN